MKRRIIMTFLFIVLCMPLGLLTGCLKTNGVLEQGFIEWDKKDTLTEDY